MRIIHSILAGAAIMVATPLAAQAPGEDSALPVPSCDRACLLENLGTFMDALRAGDAASLPLAQNVVFTENNVPLALDQGFWNTVTGVDAVGLDTADPTTGNAAWFGSAIENGTEVILAARIHVTDRLIDEIEIVVHRRTALPAPFGNVENMVHDPEFYEILPEEERSTRERMIAIGDSYFDTVEVNDGQVFAPFAEDCGRLENGISTTAPAPGSTGGNAASLMAGCLNQFKLGLYRINKRIRRDIFIVDEERGVVVARGFFDHANEFDRYNLTDGREMRTALKWPNSITLIEAFRIRNAEIQRIEAVFTYVPYFMNNLFWGPDASPPQYAPDPAACDAACLTANAKSVASAMVDNQWQQVNWADKVGYAENSVGIRIGESIWRTVTAVDANPLVVADAETGKAVWIGGIEEHGQPAWAAFTVSAGPGGSIGVIDALIRRKEYGPLYADPGQAPQYQVLAPEHRTSRAEMLAGGTEFFAALNAHPQVAPSVLDEQCLWVVNGQDVGICGDSFGGPGLGSIDQVRDRSVLAVDEERGLVIYRTFEDLPAIGGAEGSYPRTFQVVEMMHFVAGKVARIDAYSSELPFGMKPHQ
jgi:hypothetical protein